MEDWCHLSRRVITGSLEDSNNSRCGWGLSQRRLELGSSRLSNSITWTRNSTWLSSNISPSHKSSIQRHIHSRTTIYGSAAAVPGKRTWWISINHSSNNLLHIVNSHSHTTWQECPTPSLSWNLIITITKGPLPLDGQTIETMVYGPLRHLAMQQLRVA